MRYLTLALVLAMTATTFAQTGPALVLKPFAAGQSFEIGGSSTFFGDSDVDENGGDFDLTIFDAAARWQITGEDQRNVTVGYEITYLDIDSSNAIFPERFADQSIGVGFHVGHFQEWKIDAAVGVGHAGTAPYSDGRAIYYMADLIASKDIDESSSLMLFVNYNGNRSIFPDIPLPGIAYTHEVDESLSYVAGIPYSQITWKPADLWTFTLDYFIPTTINVRAEYEATDSITLFAAYENRLDSFRVKGDNEHRRVFFKQSRAELGANWQACENASLEIAGGYAFGQEFTRGYDVRDDNMVAQVDNAPYVKVALAIGF